MASRHMFSSRTTRETIVPPVYPTDLTDAQRALIAPHLPAPRRGGRPRRTDLQAVVNEIFYLLRTGCQWRLLPKDFPPWGTVWWSFRRWPQAARSYGGDHGQPVCEDDRKGGGFDGHKRIKGRKRQMLVETRGFLIACRVDPAGIFDQRAARGLTDGLAPLWPKIHTVIAGAGYESNALAGEMKIGTAGTCGSSSVRSRPSRSPG